MPHVKGNKFKPKVVVDDATAASAAALKETTSPPAINAAGSGKSEAAKKQKQAARMPNVKTVVLPPPKGKQSSTDASTSNWASMKAVMDSRKKTGGGAVQQRKRKAAAEDAGNASKAARTADKHISGTSINSGQITKVLALDCEMVGVGPKGDRSALARVSLVNSAGAVVYDSFVACSEKVTDYRTRWSGVRPADLRGAPDASVVRSAIAALIRGRLLVGHALQNDLDVLDLSHPPADLRDTAKYPPFMKTLVGGRAKPRKLRHLAQEHLGMDIQGGEHDPVEDARTALALYQKHRPGWERWVAKGAPTKKVAHTSSKKQGGGSKEDKSGPPAMGGAGLGKNKKDAGPLGSERLAELAAGDYMADL